MKYIKHTKLAPGFGTPQNFPQCYINRSNSHNLHKVSHFTSYEKDKLESEIKYLGENYE